MEIFAPVSVGEWVDKMTILEIKLVEIADPAKWANVRREYEALTAVAPASLKSAPEIVSLRAELKAVNQKLWRIEEGIHAYEKSQTFDAEFVYLARAVCQENDRRAALKRKINCLTGSLIIEEKSYTSE